MADKSGVSDQVLSLPKGGGALSGIGEKFRPNLQTGAGSLSVPIAVPRGRNDFGPSLALAYSTARGNGPCGLGWELSVPNVARKTANGVVRYRDDARPDTFVLSGLEDLVLVEEKAGTGHLHNET